MKLTLRENFASAWNEDGLDFDLSVSVRYAFLGKWIESLCDRRELNPER